MKKSRRRKPSKEPLHDHQGRVIPRDPLKDEALQRFINNVDEDALRVALEEAKDPKYQTFLRARMDPHYKNVSFMTMCRKFDISIADIDDLYRKSQIHVGMIRSSNHIPKLMEDIAIDAESRMAYCTRCDGTGTVREVQEYDERGGSGASSSRSEDDAERGGDRVCPMCKGTREVRIAGDRTARDLVYESIGLIGKKGPLVAIQTNIGIDGELGDILSKSQRVLAGSTSNEEE